MGRQGDHEWVHGGAVAELGVGVWAHHGFSPLGSMLAWASPPTSPRGSLPQSSSAQLPAQLSPLTLLSAAPLFLLLCNRSPVVGCKTTADYVHGFCGSRIWTGPDRTGFLRSMLSQALGALVGMAGFSQDGQSEHLDVATPGDGLWAPAGKVPGGAPHTNFATCCHMPPRYERRGFTIMSDVYCSAFGR